MADWDVGYDVNGNALDFTTVAAALASGSVSAYDTLYLYYANSTRGMYWTSITVNTKPVNLINGLMGQVGTSVVFITYNAQITQDVVIRGFYMNGVSSYSIGVQTTAGSTGDVYVDRCYIQGSEVRVISGSVTGLVMTSCRVAVNPNSGIRNYTTNTSLLTCINCTVMSTSLYGILYGDCYNCIVYGTLLNCYLACTGDYNYSADNVVPGANSSANVRYSDFGINQGIADNGRVQSTSGLIGAGTNSPADYPSVDLYGNAWTSPTVGCDAGIFINTDATKALESAGGTYHEPTTAEVKDGVTFGPSETYTGTYDGGVAADVAAIKAKTDKLTFTTGNNVDANIQYVHDVEVEGVGSDDNPWGPA